MFVADETFFDKLLWFHNETGNTNSSARSSDIAAFDVSLITKDNSP